MVYSSGIISYWLRLTPSDKSPISQLTPPPSPPPDVPCPGQTLLSLTAPSSSLLQTHCLSNQDINKTTITKKQGKKETVESAHQPPSRPSRLLEHLCLWPVGWYWALSTVLVPPRSRPDSRELSLPASCRQLLHSPLQLTSIEHTTYLTKQEQFTI